MIQHLESNQRVVQREYKIHVSDEYPRFVPIIKNHFKIKEEEIKRTKIIKGVFGDKEIQISDDEYLELERDRERRYKESVQEITELKEKYFPEAHDDFAWTLTRIGKEVEIYLKLTFDVVETMK